MPIVSAAAKPSLRPMFEPLFAPCASPVPPPVDRGAIEPEESPVPAAEHRRLIAMAESAAYQRGLGDGLRETSASHLATARAHLCEASTRLQELMAAIERRGHERDRAVDDALQALAARLALGSDRRALHALFARYVTAYAARLRAGDLRSFSVSAPALQYLEANCPEFLAALRAGGVVIEAGDGDTRAIFERAGDERAAIDFDALTEDIRAAFGGEVRSAGKGGVHE